MRSILSFAVTAFLLAILPGVGQAVMTQQVLTHGRRPALVSSLGTGTGLILWSGAAAVGLSTALQTYPQALTALRWLGGVLLVAIGVRTILSQNSPITAAEAGAVDPPSTGAAFLTGLATNVANPKAGVFAVVLLPQFIPDGANTMSATAALGLVWATVTVAWYWLYTWLVERGQRLLSTTKARRCMAVASGAALASVGCAVAWGL